MAAIPVVFGTALRQKLDNKLGIHKFKLLLTDSVAICLLTLCSFAVAPTVEQKQPRCLGIQFGHDGEDQLLVSARPGHENKTPAS